MKGSNRRSGSTGNKKISPSERQKSERSKNRCNERVYVNLPVTRIEKVFFRLIAKELLLDQTKLLRRIIHKLMDKYSSLVKKASEIVEDNSNFSSSSSNATPEYSLIGILNDNKKRRPVEYVRACYGSLSNNELRKLERKRLLQSPE